MLTDAHQITHNNNHVSTPASDIFPFARSPYKCELSVVIPAFNESSRIPRFLNSVKCHLQSQFGTEYEVLVVDDGSTDRQEETVRAFAMGWKQLRYLRHDRNYGKGAAVRTGMLNASGEFHLFADADGATPIQEEIRLRERIHHGADCCVASRALVTPGCIRSRSFGRNLSGRVFSLLARAIVGVTSTDTQCGFKMFRANVSRQLFQMCSESGYAFDVEILGLANHLGMRVDEVGVGWNEIPGSKVRVFRDGFQMLSDLIRVRSTLHRLK